MKRFSLLAIISLLLACCACTKAKSEGTDPSPGPDQPTLIIGCTYVQGGKLFSPEGKELALWGVNFQTPLSWEYNGRLSKVGVPKTKEGLKAVTDNNFKHIELMGANHLRCHLTPADFTDSNGNLFETLYLDALDYMVAEADKKGIYVSLAFINDMGQGGQGNAWAGGDRRKWIHDKKVVECSQKYIKQLLNRTNKYSNETYKESKNIAYWELINEPDMYSYDAIKSTPYFDEYKTWLSSFGYGDTQKSYALYRTNLVKLYINQMHELIRSQGDSHPICWGLNWHRYRNNNDDVFKGVSQSKADIVAFCNYPGQDLVSQDYWNNPKDLTSTDYTSWFKEQYENENGYRWALSADFTNKAKIVYEFETFFNQSAYLYPVQALYFRSLGVQSASMWTYTFDEIAPMIGGSHFLSLTCTPAKAASFMVAQEIFNSVQLNTAFNISSPNEQIGTNYAISKNRDIAIFSSDDKFYHSGEVTQQWNPLPPKATVKHVMGYKSSPIVEYNGTGLYFINEKAGELFITLMPNSKWVSEPWKTGNYSQAITELDYTTKNTLTVKLSAWGNKACELFQINGSGSRTKVASVQNLTALSLAPGDYVVVLK